MINMNIQNIITFIAVNLDDANIPNIDEFISDYQQIKPIEDPIFWLSCGAFICLMSGLIFADIMKSKLNNWTTKNISFTSREPKNNIKLVFILYRANNYFRKCFKYHKLFYYKISNIFFNNLNTFWYKHVESY